MYTTILSLVEGGGFEPPKSLTTDLQSAPFGHSGTPPYLYGAGDGTRTRNLLITNQLLYQLSYTSMHPCPSRESYYSIHFFICQVFFWNFFKKFFKRFSNTFLVGAEGFEPPTFWSQTRRATKLRYAPIHSISIIVYNGRFCKHFF